MLGNWHIFGVPSMINSSGVKVPYRT